MAKTRTGGPKRGATAQARYILRPAPLRLFRGRFKPRNGRPSFGLGGYFGFWGFDRPTMLAVPPFRTVPPFRSSPALGELGIDSWGRAGVFCFRWMKIVGSEAPPKQNAALLR
jgi:hypothetical protein